MSNDVFDHLPSYVSNHILDHKVKQKAERESERVRENVQGYKMSMKRGNPVGEIMSTVHVFSVPQSHFTLQHTLSHEDDWLESPQVPAPDWLVLPNVRSYFDNDSISRHNKEREAVTPHNDKQKGFPPGQSVSYIRLIWDDQKSWICSSPCENSSLSLESDALKIKVNGLYYINAQVSFTNTDKSKANQSKQEGKETVTLLRNKRDGKSKKKLTEVIRYEEGSVSINRMVYLTAGDSISLIIPQSMTLLKNEWETYWEIFSLSNQ
ncbi:lymphotoxin alpha [Triplophysa rosa]|uniref:Lymphotoxin alpha n=1 Tax=Triplophysa rosa TaxID=992332 RepID=A0A9W7TSI7_TRIRA|nr:lymphotoxin alpha [Triplophysa rosa]